MHRYSDVVFLEKTYQFPAILSVMARNIAVLAVGVVFGSTVVIVDVVGATSLPLKMILPWTRGIVVPV